MAVSVTPSALPAPKKNSYFSVFLFASGGTGPYTWAITSGALPTFLTLSVVNSNTALVSGKVPSTLSATTWTATITATDSLAATGTCVSTTIATAVDGPDPQGYHGTEANRTTVTLPDALDHGPGLSVADSLARLWPLTGPSQNS